MELPTDIIGVIRGFLPNSLNVRLVSKAFSTTGSKGGHVTYLNTPGINLKWALAEFLRSNGKLTYLEARGFLTVAADQQDLSFARTIVPHVATHSDFVWAASHGHVKVLQLLHDLGIQWKAWSGLVMDYSAQKGQIESVRWLCQHGATWSQDATKWAAFYGHLEVLQWLISNGCPYRIRDILAETRSLLWKVGAECRVWAFRFQGSDGDLFGVTPTEYTREIEKSVRDSPTLEEAVRVFADTRSRFLAVPIKIKM
jgi:hypothetical protein